MTSDGVLTSGVLGGAGVFLRRSGAEVGGRSSSDCCVLCGTDIPSIVIRYKFVDGPRRRRGLRDSSCRGRLTYMVTLKVGRCVGRRWWVTGLGSICMYSRYNCRDTG